MKPISGYKKNVNNDSYEIIELNESEPIVFKQTRRKQQELYSQNNRHTMLVIPKTIVGNSYKYLYLEIKYIFPNYIQMYTRTSIHPSTPQP
jgi:hypothetical protein